MNKNENSPNNPYNNIPLFKNIETKCSEEKMKTNNANNIINKDKILNPISNNINLEEKHKINFSGSKNKLLSSKNTKQRNITNEGKDSSKNISTSISQNLTTDHSPVKNKDLSPFKKSKNSQCFLTSQKVQNEKMVNFYQINSSNLNSRLNSIYQNEIVENKPSENFLNNLEKIPIEKNLSDYELEVNNRFTFNNSFSNLPELNSKSDTLSVISNKKVNDNSKNEFKNPNILSKNLEKNNNNLREIKENINNNSLKNSRSLVEQNFPKMNNPNVESKVKGNLCYYSYLPEKDFSKSPFENDNSKKNGILKYPSKISEASKRLDDYEKQNIAYINNQLLSKNQKHIPIPIYISSKPSLNLKESRRRIDILNAEKKYKMIEDNVNEIEDSVNYGPDGPKSDLKVKSKKISKKIKYEDLFETESKLNEKLLEYDYMSDSIDDINESDSSMKILKTSTKRNRKSKENENNSKSLISAAFKLVDKDNLISKENTKEKESETISKSNSNVSNIKRKSLIFDSEEKERKKIPENKSNEDLIVEYPELFNYCRTKDSNGKIVYDFDKFRRLIEEQINLDVPIEKKNDEIFKQKLIMKYRSEKHSTFKSAKRANCNNIRDHQKMLENSKLINYKLNFIDLLYCNLKNKQPVSSVKKNYISTIKFVDRKKRIKYFNIYKDSEMGINEYWQINLVESVIL